MNNSPNKTGPKPNLRKAQAEERRTRIIDTALKVFAAQGFQGTSIKDIAEAAGMSQGLLYHYFPGKVELLEATIEMHSFLPLLRKKLIENRDLPFQTVFTDIADGFLDLLANKKELVSIMIKEVGVSQEVANAWAKLCREGVSLIKQYMEIQIKKGFLRPHNTEVTARNLFGSLFMYHYTEAVFQDSRKKHTEYIKETLRNLLEGIGQKKDIRPTN